MPLKIEPHAIEQDKGEFVFPGIRVTEDIVLVSGTAFGDYNMLDAQGILRLSSNTIVQATNPFSGLQANLTLRGAELDLEGGGNNYIELTSSGLDLHTFPNYLGGPSLDLIVDAEGAANAFRIQGTGGFAAFNAVPVEGTRLVIGGDLRLDGYQDYQEQGSFPATPGTGYGRLFASDDGLVYWKNDSGEVFNLTSGTTGPAGESLWGLTGTSIFYNDGFVGIGTMAPAELLTLESSVRPALALRHTGSNQYLRLGQIVGGSRIDLTTNIWFNGSNFDIDDPGSDWAIYAVSGADHTFFAGASALGTGTISVDTVLAGSGLTINAGGVIVNNLQNDMDFLVRSKNKTHALFVQGSDGGVGIGRDYIPNTFNSLVVSDPTTAGLHANVDAYTNVLVGGTGSAETLSIDSIDYNAYGGWHFALYSLNAQFDPTADSWTRWDESMGAINFVMQADKSDGLPEVLFKTWATGTSGWLPQLSIRPRQVLISDQYDSWDDFTTLTVRSQQDYSDDPNGYGAYAALRVATSGSYPGMAAIQIGKFSEAIWFGSFNTNVGFDAQSGTWSRANPEYGGVIFQNEHRATHTRNALWIYGHDDAFHQFHEYHLPSGTSGQATIKFNTLADDIDFILYADDATVLLYGDAGNSQLIIGHDSHPTGGTISGGEKAWISKENDFAFLSMSSLTTGSTALNSLTGYAARGTNASPSATQKGDYFLFIGGRGFDDADWDITAGGIAMQATENWNAVGHGMDIAFQGTLTGTTARIELLRLGDETVFNQSGVKITHRIESDVSPYAFHLRGSDGHVGIGAIDPYYTLVVGDGAGTTYANPAISILSATDELGSFTFADGVSGSFRYRGWVEYDHTNDDLSLGADGKEIMVLDTNGPSLPDDLYFQFGAFPTGSAAWPSEPAANDWKMFGQTYPRANDGITPYVRHNGLGPWGYPQPIISRKYEDYKVTDSWSLFGSRFYVAGQINGSSLGNNTPVIDQIHCVPFYVNQRFVVTELGFNCVGAGGAGSVARVGIYDNNGQADPRPERLIYDGGEKDTNTTGAKSTSGLSIELMPGHLYWFVYHPGVAAPLIKCLGTAGAYPIYGFSLITSTLSGFGFRETNSYSALPAELDSVGGILDAGDAIPAIFMSLN